MSRFLSNSLDLISSAAISGRVNGDVTNRSIVSVSAAIETAAELAHMAVLPADLTGIGRQDQATCGMFEVAGQGVAERRLGYGVPDVISLRHFGHKLGRDVCLRAEEWRASDG